MTVFLERMRRRREDLALISLLAFGLVEMVQSPWAIPGISSHFSPCIWTHGDGTEPIGHSRYQLSFLSLYLDLWRWYRAHGPSQVSPSWELGLTSSCGWIADL